MVGVIGPLVQRERRVRGWIGSLLWFSTGAVAGGMAMGALLGVLGAAAQDVADRRTLGVLVGGIGCALLLADLGVLRLRTPTLRRQTCSTWYRDRGSRTAWILWGFDLGLGFSTIRLGSLYWLAALFVVAFAPPASAPFVVAFYGLGLALALAAAAARHAISPDAASPGLALLGAAGRVRLVSEVTLGLLSLTIILVSLAAAQS
jgi:hypothetical protein